MIGRTFPDLQITLISEDMISYDLLTKEGMIAIRPEGMFQSSDFKELSEVIDPFIGEKGKLQGILLQGKKLAGWENFRAFLSHLQFITHHHRHIAKVAAVTDKRFLTAFPKLANYLLSPEVRHFSERDGGIALEWLHTRV